LRTADTKAYGEGGMNTGTVRWFSESKGYGFILPEGGGKGLFVHESEIDPEDRASLCKGKKVKYEIGEGVKGGPCATDVRPC